MDQMDGRSAGDRLPAAVVAGAYQTGVLAVRGLQRRGVNAICFDCNAGYPGFRSVYGPARLSPNPDREPDEWLQFMRHLAESMGERPALLASADQFVSAIAQHEAELSKYFRLSAGAHLQGLLATKQTQYALAGEHGMPLPRTRTVNSEEEVLSFAAEAVFPCLLKPIHFREWQVFPEGHSLSHEKIAHAENPRELVEKFRLAAAVNPNVILQEIIKGPDSNKRVYLSCYDRAGKRIGRAMFRELRCEPVGFGPASATEPIADDETDSICDNFLQSMRYSGICEIEMKRDSRDGTMKMIEANPRLSGGGDAAPYAGVDICWLHYLDLIGRDVAPVAPAGRIFRHIVLRSDIRTIFAYKREGLITWGEAFRSYKPPLAFFDFDVRDWRYSIGTVLVMIRHTLAGIVRLFAAREYVDPKVKERR